MGEHRVVSTYMYVHTHTHTHTHTHRISTNTQGMRRIMKGDHVLTKLLQGINWGAFDNTSHAPPTKILQLLYSHNTMYVHYRHTGSYYFDKYNQCIYTIDFEPPTHSLGSQTHCSLRSARSCLISAVFSALLLVISFSPAAVREATLAACDEIPDSMF